MEQDKSEDDTERLTLELDRLDAEQDGEGVPNCFLTGWYRKAESNWDSATAT